MWMKLRIVGFFFGHMISNSWYLGLKMEMLRWSNKSSFNKNWWWPAGLLTFFQTSPNGTAAGWLNPPRKNNEKRLDLAFACLVSWIWPKRTCTDWWLSHPLKNMISSVGMMKFPTYGKENIHVPNQQPAYCVHLQFASEEHQSELVLATVLSSTTARQPARHSQVGGQAATHKFMEKWTPWNISRRMSIFFYMCIFSNILSLCIWINYYVCKKVTIRWNKG